MTREDIIRMAREAGGYVSEMPMGDAWLFDDAALERFAALVAALAEPEPDAIAAKYNELLMAVAQKHPDETRHETALRYITQAENQSNAPKRISDDPIYIASDGGFYPMPRQRKPLEGEEP
jgi:hypothetical protein